MRRISSFAVFFALLNLAMAYVNVIAGTALNYCVALICVGVGFGIVWSEIRMRKTMSVPFPFVPISSVGVPNEGNPPYGVFVPKTDTVIAGEIIAWRAWRTDGNKLYSTYIGCQWDYKEPMFGVPGKGFGIFAMKERRPVYLRYGGGCVIGQVALWGDVVEHKAGYRAEYARVVSLDQCGHTEGDCSTLRKLQKNYRVGPYAPELDKLTESEQWTAGRGPDGTETHE